MNTSTNTAVKSAMIAAAHAVVSNKDVLTKADQAIGDGDHGIGMARGFAAFAEALQSSEEVSVSALFETGGKALMMKAGGASGAIFGTFFRAAGGVLPEADTPSVADMAAAFEEGLNSVQRRGNAKPGDKTMIDALHPATESLKGSDGSELSAALLTAAIAAEGGVEASRDMKATTGKAKSLGDRAVGHPDPGAMTFSIFLRTFAEAL
ncbi:MAG: dihydroxyacetone kinase subunit DhaL [Jhaorihella sp.]